MNIDWTQVLLAGIAGGTIAGLIAVAKPAYTGLARRFGHLLAVAISAAAIGAVGAAAAYSPLGKTAAEYLVKHRGEARIGRVMARHMKPVLESPAFRQRIEGLSQAEINELAWQLSAQGLLRLPDDRLVRRVQLLYEAISASDEATCAAQLLGPTPEQAQRLLANLSDASLLEWSEIAAEASAASLNDAPRLAPSRVEVRQAFRRLLAALPEGEEERLAAALAHPAALDHVEACWSAKAIYRTAAGLPEDDSALVARALAAQ